MFGFLFSRRFVFGLFFQYLLLKSETTFKGNLQVFLEYKSRRKELVHKFVIDQPKFILGLISMIIQRNGKKLRNVTGREDNWRNIAEDSSKDIFWLYWVDNFLN